MRTVLQHISLLAACLTLNFIDAEVIYSQLIFSSEASAAEECEQTITWKFGAVDSRFNLDKDSLMVVMQSVSTLWAEAAGYTVLAHDPQGEVELNFYYTHQQEYSDNEQELSDKIKRQRQIYYSKNILYQRQENHFEDIEQEFNQQQAEYNDAVTAYNQTLNRIQTTGVRSRELNEKLQRLKRDIEIRETVLQTLRVNLNEQEENLKNHSDELNQYADTINELVYQYQKRFSSWKTFYQGVYINVGGKRKINIYQFDDIGRLKLLLAHEFGHALGLKHVGNPKSIMYYLTDRQNTEELQLTDEDMRAFKNRCTL
jgi:hypothetical protein